MWEIRKLRAFIDQQEAREYLHLTRVVSMGFNGGDGAKDFVNELARRAFPKPPPLEKSKRKLKRNWIKEMLSRAN